MTGIEIAVRELAQGGDQYIWNGHTTVEAKCKIEADLHSICHLWYNPNISGKAVRYPQKR